MDKINRKTFWWGVKNTPPLWIDTLAPSSYKYRVV